MHIYKRRRGELGSLEQYQFLKNIYTSSSKLYKVGDAI